MFLLPLVQALSLQPDSAALRNLVLLLAPDTYAERLREMGLSDRVKATGSILKRMERQVGGWPRLEMRRMCGQSLTSRNLNLLLPAAQVGDLARLEMRLSCEGPSYPGSPTLAVGWTGRTRRRSTRRNIR